MTYSIAFIVAVIATAFHVLPLSAQEIILDKYQIAYNVAVKDSAGNTNYEVFAMNMDGSNKRNITNHPDVSWTYYGHNDRLFFISDRDTCYRCYFLYEMDISGNHVKRISNLQLEDSWMSSRHNGAELVVTGRIGKQLRHQLFLIDSSTGDFRQITNDTSARYGDPCFSPDGLQIAFSYKKNKRDRMTPEEIYVMQVDGSQLKQLTNYPANNISLNQPGYKAGATKWHPTENMITYISHQNGRHNIYAVTTDGTKQWKLTENEFPEGWHDWSPDGKWLAYDHSNAEETQYHISMMNWKSRKTTQLTDSSYRYQQSPVFVER